MILDKYCYIKINKKNREHYTNKGYDTSISELKILTRDLIPGSHVIVNVSCDICGLEKNIIYKEYYRSFKNHGIYCCSSKCAQIKNKKTNLERYGVDNPTKNIDIIKKREISNLSKYGVRNTLQLESVKESIKLTNLERYGVDNPTKNKIIYKKVRDTINEKFGDQVFFKTKYFKSEKNNYYRQYNNINFLKKRVDYLNKIGINLININEKNEYIIQCHKGHTYSTNNDVLYKRVNIYKVDPCTICNKINNNSYAESDLYDFISLIYKGPILRNVRNIIYPYEIDIYLPDIRVGIEFNGVFWHSDRFKDKNYHKNKLKASIESKIKLFQIWEDDWIHKKDIIKSIIKNKLNLNENKIFARNCEIVEYFDNKITKKFLDDNHLQGNCKSSIKIGLLFDKKLVCLMTFSKNRYGVGSIKDNDYELSRFSVKKDHIVIGGASKIFNFFCKKYKFNNIISFADCDISDGHLYTKIGFKLHSTIKPTYYYIINGIREHRFKWRKDILKNKGLILDKETEFECMDRLNINRVYNSGHLKFIKYSISED